MTSAPRIFFLLLLLALTTAQVACGGSDPQTATPATDEVEPAGDQPADDQSAADQPASDEPAAAPAKALGCDKEVALTCAEGFSDGCLTKPKLTLVHVCVADSEKKAGPPPCKMEIARQCQAGQVDACLTKPRQAKTHVCVVAPAK